MAITSGINDSWTTTIASGGPLNTIICNDGYTGKIEHVWESEIRQLREEKASGLVKELLERSEEIPEFQDDLDLIVGYVRKHLQNLLENPDLIFKIPQDSNNRLEYLEEHVCYLREENNKLRDELDNVKQVLQELAGDIKYLECSQKYQHQSFDSISSPSTGDYPGLVTTVTC